MPILVQLANSSSAGLLVIACFTIRSSSRAESNEPPPIDGRGTNPRQDPVRALWSELPGAA
jgi:hypothetical protein